jgi:hypothetical protein
LHVDPNGLTVREFNNYSPYYGWAWFENYVLKHNQDKEDVLRKKTIIYSKYATDFKGSAYRSRCDGIVVIDKSEDKAIDKVIQAIEKIIKK